MCSDWARGPHLCGNMSLWAVCSAQSFDAGNSYDSSGPDWNQSNNAEALKPDLLFPSSLHHLSLW